MARIWHGRRIGFRSVYSITGALVAALINSSSTSLVNDSGTQIIKG